jgi:asparagine synthase (glutamine-hydrolysing)
MCGICVTVDDLGAAREGVIRAMCDRIIHRGPDSEGITVSDGVRIGMRRLSIIDLETLEGRVARMVGRSSRS